MRRLLVSAAAAALLLGPFAADLSHGGAVSAKTNCTPGYSPCIPKKSSDVDCYGGSGNGPRYTKRGVVYAVKRGYDVYRLDADHDGKGCERS